MSNNYQFPGSPYNQSGTAAQTPQNMASQRFCLRWNNHQSNLLSVFDQLLHDESFVDVTIAVEGRCLRAHKMVLSACSPYFQALFVNHPDKHPIVILKDVPYSDMRSLLDFMYRGEVSVDQDRLTAFLRVAESLRIKGLTEVNEENCDSLKSSLAHQNLHSGMPHLQRLQQNKRFGNHFNMLNHALMQPKRKRGRPRKLSGCSNGNGDDFDRNDSLVQGSPEMLEVKMGMDGFTGNNSDTSTGNNDDNDDAKVKEEGGASTEPVAGTSKEQQPDATNANNTSENDAPSSDEYYDYQENNQNHTNLPSSITVELITPIKQETVIISTEAARNMLQESMETQEEPEINTGVHFLTDEESTSSKIESTENYEKKKNELLEYLTRHDGSVVCKLCGEILASRTHWYRHKYKLHVNNLVNPAPLFKCNLCNVFFKSRKGYMGHISARHSENMEQHEELNISIKEEVVETTENIKLVNSNNGTSSSVCPTAGSVRKKEVKGADWEEQREKEEKLVADIIDRVRKECEAQGAAVTRRGYSRRTTVMNSCN